MNQEIELLRKKIVLRDVEINLNNAKLDGQIIPDIVYKILKDLESYYKKFHE